MANFPWRELKKTYSVPKASSPINYNNIVTYNSLHETLRLIALKKRLRKPDSMFYFTVVGRTNCTSSCKLYLNTSETNAAKPTQISFQIHEWNNLFPFLYAVSFSQKQSSLFLPDFPDELTVRIYRWSFSE